MCWCRPIRASPWVWPLEICGFNLVEVCDTTIALLKNPDHDIASTLLAPDSPTGGQLVCDPVDGRKFYRTGRGGVKVPARWRYDKKENLIENSSTAPSLPPSR